MSLEKHSSENNSSGEADTECTPEYDSRFFGDDTPNTPPQKCVESKKAVNINIIEDEDVVERVNNFWTPNEAKEAVQVIEIVFNDGSDWKWPLRLHRRVKSGDEDVELDVSNDSSWEDDW